MSGVLTALGTLGAVVLAGYLLGRFRVLGEHAATVLARVVFTVAIPALLVVTVGRADLHVVLSRTAAVTAVSTAIVVVGAAVVVRGLWRRPAGEATIATLGASYVNAAHLGLPLAVFLFGDAVYVVPTMLLQLLVLAPLAFTVLDAWTSIRRSWAGLRASSRRSWPTRGSSRSASRRRTPSPTPDVWTGAGASAAGTRSCSCPRAVGSRCAIRCPRSTRSTTTEEADLPTARGAA